MNSTPVTQTDVENKNNTTSSTSCSNAMCIFYVATEMIIFILGLAGNGLVIWIAGFKVKKSVVSTWYLSLAVADFIFCSTLPFVVAYTVSKDWTFGGFMCKFGSFMISLNMYSSIFLLVIISVDRCVLVMFPVWAQNKRTIRKALVTVILAWIIAATCSAPPAAIREISYDNNSQKTICRYYNNKEQYAAIIACRFVFSFIVPFVIIIICYIFIIGKLKSNQTVNSKKPVKIMTVLIVTFLICWLPFQTLSLMGLFMPPNNPLVIAYVFSLILAHANRCLNPFLYAFMGKDIKEHCYAFWSKIENAFKEEEDQNTVQGTDTSSSLPRAITLFQLVHHK
ncbi:chemokine-like receptor 1 [Pygocentrus nattereri]|uniref:G-protein coupled receptors family 1 profile domain-containing protein n=1 Tax=Pygocentrus nattereri TaxID=42514 RepID=A0AAR2LPX1_PYGNA|nr:chemokine-like receptor 1 [Pygocentrus nattereri]